MKSIIPTLVLLYGYAAVSFAQIDLSQIPLDSFRLPDIDRRALELTGSFGGGYRSNLLPISGEASNAYDFSPRFVLRYNRFLDRRDVQKVSTFSTINDFDFVKQGLSADNRKSTSFFTSNTTGYTKRRYKGSAFLLTGGNVLLQLDLDRSVSDSSEVRRDPSLRARLSGEVGFGKGRLELISDVSMALFLLKDLRDVGVNLEDLRVEDVYAFASLMAEVRNKRIFDDRRMRIQNLRDLYAFMDQQAWVLPGDPAVFAILADNWFFNSFPGRFTGKRWTFAVEPLVDFSQDRSFVLPGNAHYDLATITLSSRLRAEFRKETPVSMHKQLFRVHQISVAYTRESEERFSGPYQEDDYVEFATDHSFGRYWIPSNRASVFGGLGVRYQYFRLLGDPAIFEIKDQHIFRTGLELTGSYFISYQTRFVLDAEVNYVYRTGSELPILIFNSVGNRQNDVEVRLSASVLVSIF